MIIIGTYYDQNSMIPNKSWD